MNLQCTAYFQSLPALIQHSIIMCDLKPNTLEELKTLAETMTGEAGK